MLGKIAEIPGGLFVTAPDVVGDADATLALFDTWALEVRQAVAPVALVAQDGLTPERVPWGMIGALFIGGTTAWKMGGEAYDLVREAKRRGLWVHMGRVNSNRRLVYAKAIGCDSVDGSSASWYRDTKLPARLTWAARPPQLLLGRPPGVELSGSS